MSGNSSEASSDKKCRNDAVFSLLIVALTKVHERVGGATYRTLDLRTTGHGFKSYLGQSCITILDKLFTPMCLCHQAV